MSLSSQLTLTVLKKKKILQNKTFPFFLFSYESGHDLMSVSGSTTLKIICSSRRNSRKVRNDVWGNGSLEDKKVATYMIVWDS